jgi:hypothetical protein
MCGHDGIHPELHPACDTFECQDVGYVSDILAIPKEDLVVTGDTEMIKPFHTGKLINSRYYAGVKYGVGIEKNTNLLFGFL